MPLFITPMISAPITAPATSPTPPLKQAAMTSSLQTSLGFRGCGVEPRGEHEAR
jgi:hypothetical protein